MNDINLLMNNISNVSNIPFSLGFKEKELYKSIDFIDKPNNLYKDFLIGNREYRLTIHEQDMRVLPLLVHYVKDSLLDLDLKKVSIVFNISESILLNPSAKL